MIPTPYEAYYLLCAACTEAEAVAAFVRRFGAPPAVVRVDQAGIWAGPEPGYKNDDAMESEK
jgi:hypothetical protein